MMLFIKTHLISISGILIGAIAGYLYWQQAGCSTGTCVITSSPVRSSLYGSLMGGLLISMFKKEK